MFFPPNIASESQPPDAGIIKSFKDKHNNLFHQHIFDIYEKENQSNQIISNHIKSYNLLEIIENICRAWDLVSAETIKNCWSHVILVSFFNVRKEDHNDHNYCSKQ